MSIICHIGPWHCYICPLYQLIIFHRKVSQTASYHVEIILYYYYGIIIAVIIKYILFERQYHLYFSGVRFKSTPRELGTKRSVDLKLRKVDFIRNNIT